VKSLTDLLRVIASSRDVPPFWLGEGKRICPRLFIYLTPYKHPEKSSIFLGTPFNPPLHDMDIYSYHEGEI